MDIKGINLLTFLFQVINFFILLFILSRLLYKPLITFIQKRKEELNKCFIDAENIKKQAEILKKQYEEKLEELERQKLQIFENYKREAELEAQKIIEKAKVEAEKIFQKEKALLQKELEKAELIIKEKTKELVIKSIEKGVRTLPLEDFHESLLKKFKLELPDLLKKESPRINVKTITKGGIITAFPLEDDKSLIEIVEREIKKSLSWEITVDPELLSGIKLKLNGLIIDFSLKAQLKRIADIFEEI